MQRYYVDERSLKNHWSFEDFVQVYRAIAVEAEFRRYEEEIELLRNGLKRIIGKTLRRSIAKDIAYKTLQSWHSLHNRKSI